MGYLQQMTAAVISNVTAKEIGKMYQLFEKNLSNHF